MSNRRARLSRREFLSKTALGGLGLVAAAALGACATPTPAVIEVEKIVTREVAVEVTREVEIVKEVPVAPEIVTIEFASDWNSGARFQMITDARNMFEGANPGVHVRMLHLDGGTTFTGGFSDYVVPRFRTGTAPDILCTAATFIYTHKDFLLDMTDLLPELGYSDDDYYTVYRATHDAEGSVYGTPFNMFLSCWVYNVDLFEEAGVEPPSENWDWDELLEKARLLTDPAKDQWGVHAWNNWEYGYFPIMYAQGARFTNDEFIKTTFNTPDSVEALQWMINLIHAEKVAPTQEAAAALLGPTVADVFATGQVGMAPRGAGFQGLNDVIGDRFSYRVIQPPKSPKSGGSGAYRGMEPIMLVKDVVDRGHVDAAVKFALFLIGEEFQTHLSKPMNRVTTPVNKKVARGEVGSYLEPPPQGMENVAQIHESDYIYDHPMFAKYAEFSQALSTPVDRAFLNEITAAEALVEAEEACNQILASAI